jgi:ribulose-5-phosphate 4-epimerase/fuculose-1-phosphate aldolase
MDGSHVSPTEIRRLVSPEEWQLRVDLAACYRLVAHYRWDDTIFTHISARLPGPEHHFLINPFGMMFDEVTASSLVKIDLDGNILLDNGYRVNPAGFTIHSAIHAGREDARCVLHVHTQNGVAVSAQRDGLLPISQQSMMVLSSLGYHDYEGLAVNPDEKPRLVGDIADKIFLMLRNHGLLVAAPSIPDAFMAMYTFEAACAIQIKAQAGGGDLIPIAQEIQDNIRAQSQIVSGGMGGQLAWPALLRRLDRIDPSYRD